MQLSIKLAPIFRRGRVPALLMKRRIDHLSDLAVLVLEAWVIPVVLR